MRDLPVNRQSIFSSADLTDYGNENSRRADQSSNPFPERPGASYRKLWPKVEYPLEPINALNRAIVTVGTSKRNSESVAYANRTGLAKCGGFGGNGLRERISCSGLSLAAEVYARSPRLFIGELRANTWQRIFWREGLRSRGTGILH